MKNIKRKSNIELLRIVLILMIISHHIIVHALGLKDITSPDFEIKQSTYIEILLNSFFVIGVNCFVFISGYFGIKYNLKRILSIIIQAITYSVIFYLIISVLNPGEFNTVSLIKSFFPISTNVWWFITTYVGLYFIAPFLNAGINNLGKHELFSLLIGIFILNCFSSFIFGGISGKGYNLFHFIFLYLIGRYLKQNELKINKPKLTLLLSTLIIGLSGIALVYFNHPKTVWHLFYYNNPILIISSISLFYLFYTLNLEYSKYINLLAQTVLGVYMIHDYSRIRDFLVEIVHELNTNYNSFVLLLLLALLIVIVFLLSSFIEFIRLNIYNYFSKKLYKLPIIIHLSSKIKMLINY